MSPFRFDKNPLPDTDEQGSQYFRIILENARQLIGLLSIDGIVLEINLPILNARQLSRNEVVGKYIWDTEWWQDQPEAQEMIKNAVREASQGKTVHYKSTVPGRGQKTLTIDFTLRPIRNSDGEIIYLLPEGRDISDLVESIEKLRKTQKMLEQANHIAGLGYWSWDVASDQVQISDELARIFDEYGEAEINNYQELMRYVHPEDRVVILRTIQDAISQDRRFSTQFRITRRDGAVRTLRGLGQVTRDDSGALTQVNGTVQDITEIKSLENRLLDSEERHRYLVQALPNTGVVLYDSELAVFYVEGDNTIKKVSQGKDPLGLSVTEFLAHLLEGPPEKEITVFKDVLQGKTHTYEHITGEDCYSISVVPLRNNDNEIYAGMAVIQDITQRIRIAEKLKHLANQLRMLNQLGQIVVANKNTQYIYKEVLTRVREIVGAQGVYILLEKNGQLIVEAQDDENKQNLRGLLVPLDDSVSGEAWRNQEGIILSGEECRSRFFKPRAESMGYTPQSFLAVPITWRDRKFGVLDAVDSGESKFNNDDLKLAESAAAWTAIALNNAMQHQHLERRVAETEITANLLEEILNARLTLKSVLQHVVEAGRIIVADVDWSAIHLLDERDNRLRLEAVAGITVLVEEYTLESGQGIAGRVLESGDLINVADVGRDDRVAGYPRASHAHSLLVAPIKNRDGSVIGTITLQSSRIDHFSGEDERLLVLLAHQAGLAIENARLYETAEHRWHIAQIQRERLRQLTHQLVTAQENERERIARELHDEAGQSLTALKISLEILSNKLPAEMQEARQALLDAAEQTGLTLENLRSIAHNLRPPALDRLGLNLALMSLCQQFESMTRIRTVYEGFELPRLPSSHEINLYRFVQEALTNVAKHADATEVRVWLDTQTGQVEIHVQDNGKGMQVSSLDLDRENQEGMGLTSMEERLNIIDGRLEVNSVPGKGTHLRARVVLRLRETPA